VASVQRPALVVTQAVRSQLIGQVGLGDRGNKVVELVYGTAPDHRGRGYATHAARLVARWLLDEVLADEIELRIGESHLESQEVAVRAGFTPAGVVVSNVQAPSDTHNDLRFVMLPSS
jgi:RimJ/RimL family protein N-acetyltransferase